MVAASGLGPTAVDVEVVPARSLWCFCAAHRVLACRSGGDRCWKPIAMKTTFSILFTLLLIAAMPAQEESRAPRQERDPGLREARIEQMRQRLRERLDRLDATPPMREDADDDRPAAPERSRRRMRRDAQDDGEARPPAPPWRPRPDGEVEPPAGPRQGMRRGERGSPEWQPPMPPEARAGQRPGRRAEATRPMPQFRPPFPPQVGPEGQPGPWAPRRMGPPGGFGLRGSGPRDTGPQGFGPRQFGPQGFGPQGVAPQGFGPGRFPPTPPQGGELPRRGGPGFLQPGAGRPQVRQEPDRPMLRRMIARRIQLQMRGERREEGRAQRRARRFEG